MPSKINDKVNVLTPAAREPVTNYDMIMKKIVHDSHKKNNDTENTEERNTDGVRL